MDALLPPIEGADAPFD